MFEWRREWGFFLVAVQMLTRVPVNAPHGAEALGAVRYFPLVGVLVGVIAAGVFGWAAAGLGAEVASVLSLGATVLLTGGLHEDGLADCCDGLFGGRTREDALRIMRDSRVGAFGVLGVGLVLGAKVLAVAALPQAGMALVAGHAAGRFWMAATPAVLRYARPDGMAAAVAAPDASTLVVAGVFGLGPLLLLGPRAAAALAVSGAVAVAFGWWARRRVGGYTGDVLGAMQVLTEVAVLLAALWHVG